ncbi:MAG: gamma-glutamyltransferase [Flavobacteriales bacterium]|jgi:gamma-glutamyltranspeptidase/glutathione hydrolase|tara:strand:- start:13788 stop:15467 length:1680 start_codon:yes stop_codon:yes gene_type:complete
MKFFIPHILLFIFLFLNGCTNNDSKERYKNGMVVSAKIEASNAGIEILKKGGNAFDAMIATDLALSVVYPNAGNIGGGGFMVYRLSNGENGTLDFREKSPKNSFEDMYLDKFGNEILNLSTKGALAVAVPGTIAGLFEVYEKFGSLPLEVIFKPAINLAENGFILTAKQVQTLNNYRNEINEVNGSLELFKNEFKEGDFFINKAYGRTLRRILNNGEKEFYNGEIAKEIVDYLNDKGGIITLEDLSMYKPVWRNSLELEYKGLKIITMGPPSSGGIVLGQILKMIEPFDLSKLNHNSEKYIQLLTESERRSFADRSKYLGDPDFNYIPVKKLLDKNYINSRMKDFTFDKATPSASVFSGELKLLESNETTHYSIADSMGNIVSVTTTLNGNYGSKLFPPNLGFFLNNEMDDFSKKPGLPNMYGLIGGEINSVQPGKRMLSSMTPTIVEKNNMPYMVLGSPGGPTIITSVLQTILNFNDFNFNIQKSVDLPRFHHLWFPDKIFYENKLLNTQMEKSLIKKGYLLNNYPSSIGRVDAIYIDNEGYFFGGADKRGDDKYIGF